MLSSSVIKNIVNLFVRLGRQATPELIPDEVQIIRGSRETDAQKQPLNAEDVPAHLEEVFLRKTPLPEQIIYKFKNVVVSWNGIVIKQFRLFAPSLAFFTYEEEYSGAFLLRQWFSKKVILDKQVGLVFDNWSVANYYHWLIDTLPRLLLLREKCPDCILLVPAPTPDYVSLTVAALGFRNTFELTKNSFVQVQSLVMPSHITHPGYQEPILVRSVRKELLRVFGGSANTNYSLSKRIYVSRSRQKIRRLLNEEEILPLLLKYKFEVVYFEDMSFEQQVKLVQEAQVMMGVHGANLTNMLFMSPGSQIIELLNGQIPNPCYFQLASNLEMSYQALLCYPNPGPGAVNNHDINSSRTWIGIAQSRSGSC